MIDAPDERLRRQVMASVDRVLQRAGLLFNHLPLSQKIRDVAMLEARLANNTRRERLAATARARSSSTQRPGQALSNGPSHP